MLEVEVKSGEANHGPNREGHFTPMLVGIVPLTVLNLGDGDMGLQDVVMDEAEGRGGCGVGGVNEEGGKEDRVIAMVEEEGKKASGGRDRVVIREISHDRGPSS